MKKILTIIIAIVLVICAFFAVVFFTADIRVQTSTSGILSSSYHGYRYNSIFKIRFPSFLSKEDIELHSDCSSLEDAKSFVLSTDSDFFDCDGCSSPESYVFEIDNYIYYYHNEDYSHFYRINRDTGVVETRNFSSYIQKCNGMHNFSVANRIIAEGLIDYYDMRDAIESIDGMFYECDVHYCDGRVFFEKSNHLYEYMPSKDAVRLIGSVGSDENIELIWEE